MKTLDFSSPKSYWVMSQQYSSNKLGDQHKDNLSTNAPTIINGEDSRSHIRTTSLNRLKEDMHLLNNQLKEVLKYTKNINTNVVQIQKKNNEEFSILKAQMRTLELKRKNRISLHNIEVSITKKLRNLNQGLESKLYDIEEKLLQNTITFNRQRNMKTVNLEKERDYWKDECRSVNKELHNSAFNFYSGGGSGNRASLQKDSESEVTIEGIVQNIKRGAKIKEKKELLSKSRKKVRKSKLHF